MIKTKGLTLVSEWNIPDASHTDLYDGGANGAILWDRLVAFSHNNLQ